VRYWFVAVFSFAPILFAITSRDATALAIVYLSAILCLLYDEHNRSDIRKPEVERLRDSNVRSIVRPKGDSARRSGKKVSGL